MKSELDLVKIQHMTHMHDAYKTKNNTEHVWTQGEVLKFVSIQFVLFLSFISYYYPSFNYIIMVTYVETVTY